ncbi:MAG: DUF5996 family protein [Acidimicrobiia bacterium]|nr:DUF5996 family protein [Acidimicrobiia bacterium]
MTTQLPLLPMPDDWEPTRATLHLYAHALGVIARAHAVPNENWWHISLKVRPSGLCTDTMPLPGGGTFDLRMDFRTQEAVLETSGGEVRAVSMAAGRTGSEFGRELIGVVGEFGISADYATEKFADDEPRPYDPAGAEGFFQALVNIDHNLEIHRSSLMGAVGPLQVWPHGFDLSFEWFGTRVVGKEEGGATTSPAQLNLGFYPAGRPYFYSNPSPFDPSLVDIELPAPAEWHTEGWEGSILYYDDLLKTDEPTALLLEYAKAVHEAARPTLTTEV